MKIRHPMMDSRKIVTVVVAGVVASLAASLVPAPALADALEEARQRRAALQARIAQVASELEHVAVRVDEAQALRQTIESDVARLQRAASVADASLAARAVALYKHGNLGDFQMLLDAGGPGEAVTRSRMLAGVGRQERETIERAAVARLTLARRKAELEQVAATLSRDQARLVSLRAQLDRAFADAKAREGELVSRRTRQRRVSRGRQNGLYACPLGQPLHFRDTWGAPRSGGRRHKGVDMFAPMGTPVYAMTNGVIARHSSSRLGGIGLYLRGDDGNEYYYAHLQRILPGYGPGRRVEAGELIATNGDTGNARGGSPHVHFEVHPGGGRPVNPYPFTAAACF
jgi:murein DD-endopeptidase MepM/ murein hydrolase activator NlpD